MLLRRISLTWLGRHLRLWCAVDDGLSWVRLRGKLYWGTPGGGAYGVGKGSVEPSSGLAEPPKGSAGRSRPAKLPKGSAGPTAKGVGKGSPGPPKGSVEPPKGSAELVTSGWRSRALVYEIRYTADAPRNAPKARAS